MAQGYRLNFKAQYQRPGNNSISTAFGAASDAAAIACAAEIANWSTAQQSSLYGNIFQAVAAPNASYPVGSRWGFKSLVMDSTAGIWRVNVRNIIVGTTEVSWANILSGQADATTGAVALSAPPGLPNTGNPVWATPDVARITLF